jgi:hypothetical protein
LTALQGLKNKHGRENTLMPRPKKRCTPLLNLKLASILEDLP